MASKPRVRKVKQIVIPVARPLASRPGKARTAILLWLLGVPIPLIVLFFLIRSCVGG
ncbi:MAG: hypothetical protein U0570_12915 [Phycisphaerales bacterium]